MSRHSLVPFLVLAMFASISMAESQRAKRKPAKPTPAPKVAAVVTPQQHNQFVTIEEFLRTRPAAGTAVSVEGYAVIGVKNAGGVKLIVIDSVDHVLSAADANKFAAGGATAIIPAAAVAKRAVWGMVPKGMNRFAMYTGAGMAQRPLHDVVPKLRITGRANGRTINVTGVEFADDNGDWKKL